MSCIIGDIKYIIKVADNIAKNEIIKRNLPITSRHIILFHTINYEKILFSDLQYMTQFSKSTLSDAINKYEKLGLIIKSCCENDKRNIHISLTNNGLKILQELVDLDDYIKSIILKDFSIEEKKNFEIYVHKSANKIKNYK